ncbi:MAG: hypothetical protein LC128_08015 [Chitinophagales bacterium]|nr:hypothetical protein [Chitinophagales bacterium]
MFAKVKSSIFIDALQFELNAPRGECLRGVIKDEKGSVCSILERDLISDTEQFTWSGLNDLPYGVYTLELTHGEDEMKMRLVKRV